MTTLTSARWALTVGGTHIRRGAVGLVTTDRRFRSQSRALQGAPSRRAVRIAGPALRRDARADQPNLPPLVDRARRRPRSKPDDREQGRKRPWTGGPGD